MATMPPDDANLFQAPTATIGGPVRGENSSDAELIRQTYIKHETSVRSLGLLYYLGAVFGVFGTLLYTLMAVGLIPLPQQNDAEVDPRLMFGLAAIVALVATVINGGLGYGLRNLQVWARWVVMIFTGLGLGIVVLALIGLTIFNPLMGGVGFLIYLLPWLIGYYIFWLMYSAKGAMVFSAEYREVVRQTPYIKSKTSLLVKILIVLLVGTITLAFIAGIMSGLNGR